MEEKKLLRILKCNYVILMYLVIVIQVYACISYADSNTNWFETIANESKQSLIDRLKAKLDNGELNLAPEYIQELSNDDGDDYQRNLQSWKEQIQNPRPNLQIFVSCSMPINLLRSYAIEAARYDGVLVIRGLPDNSFINLSQFVLDVIGDNNAEEIAGLQIDDNSFELYEIKAVPTIVFAKNNGVFGNSDDSKFDKISGNMDIQAALKMIAKDGELRDEARALLKQ